MIKKYKPIKAVETDKKISFCTSCNTQVVLGKYVKVIEGEPVNINNKIKIFVGQCKVCKTIYFFNKNKI